VFFHQVIGTLSMFYTVDSLCIPVIDDSCSAFSSHVHLVIPYYVGIVTEPLF
jgi:hypothetical protein